MNSITVRGNEVRASIPIESKALIGAAAFFAGLALVCYLSGR